MISLWRLILFIVMFHCDHSERTSNVITQKLFDHIDSLSKTVSARLDQITLQTMNYGVGATSLYFPLGTNQSLHVLDFKGSGTSPPIVLVHGISSCASDYYPIIYYLQQYSSRIIAIDLPGHGNTIVDPKLTLDKLEILMVDSICLCLKNLGIRKCTLLGNSLGGFAACKYASKFSNSLHSLVLISPAGAPLSKSELSDIQHLFNISTLGDAVNFLDSVFGTQNRLPWGLRHVVGWACRERSRRPAVQRILQEATISNRLREPEVASISCPVLLVWGQRESIFKPNQLKWFLKHLPSRWLSLVRPKDVGHIPHLDAKAVSESIATFLRSLE